MQTLINSIPEPLAIAIITSVFTGLIIFYFQKRIDKSITEKTEEFKTILQKSSIEHQIKFSKTYPRTLEILEKGYEKFRGVSQYFTKLNKQYLYSNQPLDQEEYMVKISSSLEVVREYSKYFQDNRLFIPDELLTKLNEINSKVGALGHISMGILGYRGQPLDSLIAETEHISMMIDMPMNMNLDLKESDKESLIHTVIYSHSSMVEIKFILLSQEFEKLYKSVAEAW